MLVAVQLVDAGAVQSASVYDDFPVQCGTMFFIMWKGYEMKNVPELAGEYHQKYQALIEEAESNLKARGLSKEDSDRYLQDHVDFLLTMAEKETELLSDFRRLCDSKFSMRRAPR